MNFWTFPVDVLGSGPKTIVYAGNIGLGQGLDQLAGLITIRINP